jgi:hypothetical protein
MDFAWEIFFGLGTLSLLGALAYGAWSYHTRNRANDRVTEKATHELYAHSDTYADKREQLQNEIRPS